jgi:hypothetical protein
MYFMENPGDWKMSAQLELQQAEAARAIGNEGRARVCARRAAGIIGREYLRRHGVNLTTPSAYQVIRSMLSSPNLSPETRANAGHFLMQVDTDFTLPAEIDLVAEARWLASEILGETL